jgi:hypothetical protein
VDEAAVAFVGAFGGCSVGHGAEKFALFGCFAATFLTGFGFAVEGLGEGGRAALLAEGEDLDFEVAAFGFDAEHVADADFAGGFDRLLVGEDALQLAGFGGLLAGLEEAGGPEPLVDAGSGHAFYSLPRTVVSVAESANGLIPICTEDTDSELDGSEHPSGQGEEGCDELECASDYDAYEAEG